MTRLHSALAMGLLLLSPLALASPGSNEHDVVAARADDTTPAKSPKYFHEPGGSLARSHYDSRYFTEEVPYSQHRFILRDLVRSYLTIFHDLGIETWLAHGTLLGWWWNGRTMPWDYDLDVQVSNHTLSWLGAHLNGTEHAFNATDPANPDGELHTKSYLLDVNPHHVDVTRGDGRNIIDARWIDTSNGMFIDITGIRERDSDRPGLWSCKNSHSYDSSDLWPMRLSEFEGVQVRIPYNFQRILSDEYGEKGIVAEEWQGHRWDANIKEWVKMSATEEKISKEDAQRHKQADLEAQDAGLDAGLDTSEDS